jgi:hypothetical protein
MCFLIVDVIYSMRVTLTAPPKLLGEGRVLPNLVDLVTLYNASGPRESCISTPGIPHDSSIRRIRSVIEILTLLIYFMTRKERIHSLYCRKGH